MARILELTIMTSLLGATAVRAEVDGHVEQEAADMAVTAPGAVEAERDDALRPPSMVPVATTRVRTSRPPGPGIATTRRWGGGVRLTGLSGIGALPGVNYGGELAANVRHDEYFAELAFGWWKPEDTLLVAASPERVELGLNVWTLRGGWASMHAPLRGWLLVEAGEIANARGMPGVVTRMMTGDTPQERRWQAVGAGFGVAWPMGDNARLVGMIELAVPVTRGEVMLDQGGAYEPEALAARSSAGLEIGWR